METFCAPHARAPHARARRVPPPADAGGGGLVASAVADPVVTPLRGGGTTVEVRIPEIRATSAPSVLPTALPERSLAPHPSRLQRYPPHQ
ncbi:hypothetical protein [Streptomyces sp. YKOK-I1]